jgi:hypothetical protein
MFFSSSRVYQDYDACLVNFDNRNFKALVPDFPCPVISREQVIRYLEFGAQDAWGKRREQNPVSLGTPKELAERFATTWIEMMRAEGSLASEAVYSLDIRGISGGQWHFTPDARPDQAVINSGLCDSVAGHLVIDTNELLVAVGLSEATPAQQLQEAISRLPIEDFILRQRGHMSQRLAGQPQLNAGAVIHSHR